MSVLGKLKFYYKRGGLSATTTVIKNKLGIIDNAQKQYELSINDKFRDYFANLEKLKYKDELLKQFSDLGWPQGVEDIQNPKTINEKIQWLKIHDATHEKTILSDKWLVRDWVRKKIGDSYLIGVVGGPWKSGEEIEWDMLPNKFVLKANLGSGLNLIVTNKQEIDRVAIIKEVNKWVKILYGYYGLEVQYFDIPGLIYAEEYLENDSREGLHDYKVWCFNGVPKYVQYINGRLEEQGGVITREAFYDIAWNRQEFYWHNPPFQNDANRPEKLAEMLECSERLAEDFKFVRADFYVLSNGDIKFGEMTFTPNNGSGQWHPESANEMLGEELVL